MYRGIAQLVEYRSPKPWVAGSNPPAPAKTKNHAVGVVFGFDGVRGEKRVQVASNAPIYALLMQLAAERSEAGFRILLPLPSL